MHMARHIVLCTCKPQFQNIGQSLTKYQTIVWSELSLLYANQLARPAIFIVTSGSVYSKGMQGFLLKQANDEGLPVYVQAVAFGKSFNLNLQPKSIQCQWFLLNGTWLNGHGELDHRLRLEIKEVTLQMQQVVLRHTDLYFLTRCEYFIVSLSLIIGLKNVFIL